MRDKYENILYFVHMLCDNENISFNEKLTEMMMQLDDEEKIKKMTPVYWQKLVNICEETENVPLMISILKNKNAPVFCTDRIATMHNGIFKPYTICSEAVSEHYIINLINQVGTKEIMSMLKSHGNYFSNSAIDYLCKRPNSILEEMKYYPFTFVRKGCKTYKNIQKMIENKENEFFKDDVPVEFLTQIASNKNISDEIRNMAFKKDYSPELLKNKTNEMINDIYTSCADAIFNITADTIEEFEAQEKSDEIISNFVKNNELTDECRVDFINRMSIHQGQHPKSFYEILSSAETDKALLIQAIHNMGSDKVINAVLKNKDNLSENVMAKLLENMQPILFQDAFISSVLRNTLSEKVTKHFLTWKNSTIMNAFMISYYTPNEECDKIIEENNSGRVGYKPQLEYLYTIRKFVYKEFSMPMSQLLMNEFLYQLMKHNLTFYKDDLFSSTHPTYKHLKNEISNHRGWCNINDDKKEKFEELFRELRTNKKYRNFLKVTKVMENNMNDAYKKSMLPNKYPNIFLQLSCSYSTFDKYSYNNDAVIFDVNFNEIDKLTKEQLNIFIEDVKDNKDSTTLTMILDSLKNELSNTNILEIDNIQKKIYKYADLYNVLTDKLQEIESRDVEIIEEQLLPF